MNFNPKEINFLFTQLKNINGYVIIIGRMKVKQMQYAINAIYYLESKMPPFTLKQAFIGLENNSGTSFDKVFTEDSVTVAKIYSEQLGIEVQTVGSNSRFFKEIRKIKNLKKPLLIADNSKFGPSFLELLEKLDLTQFDFIGLFVPACFEEVLLSSIEDQDLSVFHHISDGTKFTVFDSEDYCEAELLKVCPKYRKKTLTPFITCMKAKKQCTPCNFNLENSSLIELFLQMINNLLFTYKGSRVICYSLDAKKLRDIKSIDNNYVDVIETDPSTIDIIKTNNTEDHANPINAF